MSKTKEASLTTNTVVDRMMQGAGIFAILFLAFQDLTVKYIRAQHPMNFILAGVLIGFVLYIVIAPLFRK